MIGNIVRGVPNYRHSRLQYPNTFYIYRITRLRKRLSHKHLSNVPSQYIEMSNNNQQPPSNSEDELSRIDALIAQHSDVFEGGPQLRYSKNVRYGEDKKGQSSASSVPHGGYRCHKCGDAGHFIQDCPMNTEEGRAGKVRQARGIPRTFLESITEAEAAKAGGAFVSAEGGLVVMKSASKEERLRMVGPSVDVELQRVFGKCWGDIREMVQCFLCAEAVKNPVITQCCGELFCKQCIVQHLDRRLMECPNCELKDIVPASLVGDLSMASVVGERALAQAPKPGAGKTRLRTIQPSRQQKTTSSTAKLDIDLEDDILGIKRRVTEKEKKTTVRRRKPNTVLVPGGSRNPFFEMGAKLMSESEYIKWQTLYREALGDQFIHQ